MWYKLCSTILSAKSLKFPPSQKNVYLEISVLIGVYISAVFQPYNCGNYCIKMISFEISLVDFQGPILLRPLEKSYIVCCVPRGGLFSLILVTILPTICQTSKIKRFRDQQRIRVKNRVYNIGHLTKKSINIMGDFYLIDFRPRYCK